MAGLELIWLNRHADVLSRSRLLVVAGGASNIACCSHDYHIGINNPFVGYN